jgi:predicted DNA-binding protein (MmcQ/YjbR family)
MTMMDIEPIFRYKAPNAEKLAAYGFLPDGEGVSKTVPILRGAFGMAVTVAPDGAVRFKVVEKATGEEYVLVHVDSAQGGFVGDVRKACEKALADIAARCFDTEILRAEQTRTDACLDQIRVLRRAGIPVGNYPDYAAFRRPDNRKWFAIIMTVDRGKLGLPGRGNVEIIDLKGLPADVEARLAEGRFLKAYHMNKTHWFTVCLDGSVPDEELFALIAESWQASAGGKDGVAFTACGVPQSRNLPACRLGADYTRKTRGRQGRSLVSVIFCSQACGNRFQALPYLNSEAAEAVHLYLFPPYRRSL